jgi:hypothetical protein
MAHDDTLQLLGKLAPTSAGRDAIHIAVVPLVAAHDLVPGQHVGWATAAKDTVGAAHAKFGVVDPYLTTRVKGGERVFIFLYPASITGLRHVWSHPEFREEGEEEVQMLIFPTNKADSERWIRDFIAGRHHDVDLPDHGTVLDAIDDHLTNDWGDEAVVFGQNAYGDIPPEFWDHYEIMTGRKVPARKRASHFRCAC